MRWIWRAAIAALPANPYRVIRMKIRNQRNATLLGIALIGLAVSAAAAAQLSRAQGDAMERKIAGVAQNGSADPVKPKRTALSELEINSYLN